MLCIACHDSTSAPVESSPSLSLALFRFTNVLVPQGTFVTPVRVDETKQKPQEAVQMCFKQTLKQLYMQMYVSSLMFVPDRPSFDVQAKPSHCSLLLGGGNKSHPTGIGDPPYDSVRLEPTGWHLYSLQCTHRRVQ